MWTVYDHPTDYPDGYFARLWEVYAGEARPTGHTMSGFGDWGLRMIRAFMRQQGFACLSRNEGDDPAILETWL